MAPSTAGVDLLNPVPAERARILLAHVTHILGKLGAANRTQAAVRARHHGLLP